MSTTTGLMTVAEFMELPETGPFYYELHHGELVKVARPKLKHAIIQRRLRQAFESFAGTAFWVQEEFTFRPLAEHEVRVADVAVIAEDRFAQADLEDYLHGAPDLVVEVLSPSNTVAEMAEKEVLCLENGCKQFWVADSKLRQVKVSTPDGLTRTYKAGDEIPLSGFGEGSISVNSIFE